MYVVFRAATKGWAMGFASTSFRVGSGHSAVSVNNRFYRRGKSIVCESAREEICRPDGPRPVDDVVSWFESCVSLSHVPTLQYLVELSRGFS